MENRRIESIKKKSDFLEIKKNGKRVRLNNWLLLNFKKNNSNKFRLGMTVPKKIGVAVIRNKLKRWCRECMRKGLQPDLPGVDINVVFLGTDKNFFKKMEFKYFREAFEQGLSKVTKVI